MKKTKKNKIQKRTKLEQKKIQVPKLKDPVKVFTSCPSCGSKEIFPIDEQVFCTDCSWNSIKVYADLLFSKIDLLTYEQMKLEGTL